MKFILVPFFRQHPVEECEKLVLNPKLIDKKFEADTAWLAKRMCGLEDEEMDEGFENPDKIVITAHENLPKEFSTVKAYRVDRIQ